MLSPGYLSKVETDNEVPNFSWSILLEATAISVIAALCLVWAIVASSPAPVLLLGLFAMSYINYLVGGRDVLYPAFTFTAIWVLVVTVYNFCPIEIDRIGWKTIWIFLAGGASFSIGSVLGNRPLLPNRSVGQMSLTATQRIDNQQARNVLLGCIVILTFLFVLLIVKVAGGIFAVNLAFLLRLNAPNSPLEDSGALTRIVAGSGGLLPVLTLWVLVMEEKRRWAIVICTVCVIAFPLFVTQRGLVMMAFCGCITLALLKKKDRRFSKMVRPLSFAAFGIVALMAVMSLTKFWAQTPGGFSVTKGIWMYIAGPLAAFNYAVYHPEAYEDQPAAVFEQVLTPLSRLQLIRYQTWLEVDGSTLDRFAYVPFPANVYTAYKPYYEDFGVVGCFIAFMLFGFIEGYLFHAANSGGQIASFFLAYLSMALMFSTFDDGYHSFSRHLNIVIFVIGYFSMMKRMKVRL